MLSLRSRGFRSRGIRGVDQNGGTRFKLRTKSKRVGEARADMEAEMGKESAADKSPIACDDRKTDSPVVGVWRAGAIGAFRAQSR